MLIFNHSTNHKKSQSTLFILSSLALFSLLVFIMFLNINLNIKILLTFFLALTTLFIYNNKIFLYFVFLISPGLRVISQEENIYGQINFNAVLHVCVIVFGIIIFLKNKEYLIKKIKETKFIKLFIAFIILSTLSLIYSVSPKNSIDDLVRLYSYFFLFISTLAIAQNKKEAQKMLTLLVLGAIVPILVGFWQLINGIGWYDSSIRSYRIFGTMIHPATFSFFLLVTLPISYALAKLEKNKIIKTLYLSLSLVFVFLIFATMTRSAWIAFLFMALVYAITKNKKAIVWLLLGFMAVYVFIPAVNQRVNDIFDPKYNSSFKTRLNILTTTLPAFENHPLIGSGFGTFEVVNLKYNDEARFYESLLAHNDYLKTLIEQGLIGLVLYLILLFSTLKYFYNLQKNTNSEEIKIHSYSLFILWLGAMVIAGGDNLMRTVPVEYIIWSYTAIVISMNNKTKK